MECILVKISDISPPFSYVRNTYPNEKKEGWDFDMNQRKPGTDSFQENMLGNSLYLLEMPASAATPSAKNL